MCKMFAYLFTSIRKLDLVIFIFILNACADRTASVVEVSPKHFKVQTPFVIDERGIIINTYWGNEKRHHVLCLDNNSPSWIKNSVVTYNSSFIKSKKFGFRTTTADGSPIQGDVGICDSIFFERVAFRNVPFYVRTDNFKNYKNDDGVLGIDAMSTGIWKIDFKNSELTFVSDIDSLPEIKNRCEIFPATFNRQVITVNVDFGNNNVKTMAIDLGYNGYMLVPFPEFKDINLSDSEFINLSAPNVHAGESLANNLSIRDTVRIDQSWFYSIISSNETVKERLVGLKFFHRFDYVIFDFIHKRVYIPRKIW